MVLTPVLKDVLHDPNQDSLDFLGGFLPSDVPGQVIWNRFNSGITVTGSGVSQWDDVSGQGNHLLQGTDANRPSLQGDGSILFDGLAHFLKAAAFTWNQPETIYVLLKQVTWTNNGYLFDGITLARGRVLQSGTTPNILANAGLSLAASPDLVLDTYGVLSIVWNGVSSVFQVDDNTPITGDAGANNMGGFTLGSSGNNDAWGHIQVKEVVGYNTAHDAATRAPFVPYLQSL